MNSKSYEILKKFIPETYLHQAQQAQTSQENEIRILIEKVVHSAIIFIFSKKVIYLTLF
jgi:hypothetical protein